MLAEVTTPEPGAVTTRYEIVVRGTLQEEILSEIGAQSADVGHGKTVILVDVIDQSHLHGVLGWLHDRNIAVERVNPL